MKRIAIGLIIGVLFGGFGGLGNGISIPLNELHPVPDALPEQEARATA